MGNKNKYQKVFEGPDGPQQKPKKNYIVRPYKKRPVYDG